MGLHSNKARHIKNLKRSISYHPEGVEVVLALTMDPRVTLKVQDSKGVERWF